MKREEKNQQMIRRIMDSALQEFSERGYGASSVNTIASAQGMSKGIIYHYFRTKDDLFLACVEECYCRLTRDLEEKMREVKDDPGAQLETYFSARANFFVAHPIYQHIFCEAMMMPPPHLEKEILEKRKAFDGLNIAILSTLLTSMPLRKQITREDVIKAFGQFQNFMNAKSRAAALSPEEFRAHEQEVKKALDILLYGVIERKERI